MKNTVQNSFDVKRNFLELYNCKIKKYPDGTKNITYSSLPIFHPSSDDVEKLERIPSLEGDGDGQGREEQDNSDWGEFREDVLKRNREKVFDIVYMNPWEWFLTITFDPKLVSWDNVSEAYTKLENWLDNRVKRYDLHYILIPEKFKSGNGFHCHALIYGGDLRMEYSGRVRVGKKSPTERLCNTMGIPYTEKDMIYNCRDWKYGFSTAMRVSDNSGALSVYLTKYITKGADRIFGRYYWSSRNIVRECETEYCNVPYDKIELPEYAVPGTGYRLKYQQCSEYTVGGSSGLSPVSLVK